MPMANSKRRSPGHYVAFAQTRRGGRKQRRAIPHASWITQTVLVYSAAKTSAPLAELFSFGGAKR